MHSTDGSVLEQTSSEALSVYVNLVDSYAKGSFGIKFFLSWGFGTPSNTMWNWN